jgi:glycosyltransferase involved in cell wall biosynthesis
LNYKYRKDVKIISTLNEELPAQITAAAYALILPGENELHLIAAVQAIESDVPVIAIAGTAIDVSLGTAVLCAGEKNPKEIGESMMRLYTDEPFRARLIEKGRMEANKYSLQYTGGILWQPAEKSYT